MTREKAMQIPALAGAVNEIAETVANVPIKLYKRGAKRVEEVKGEIDSLYPNRQYPFKPVYKIHISSMKGKEICEINWNNGEGLF